MYTQAKFSISFGKINAIFFSGEPKFPLTSKVGPKPKIKKLIFWLSTSNDELLSTPKIITFLAVSLPKIHQSPLSNAIWYMLYAMLYAICYMLYAINTYLSLSLFFTILVSPNRQFFNVKFLGGTFGQTADS